MFQLIHSLLGLEAHQQRGATHPIEARTANGETALHLSCAAGTTGWL